MGMPQAVHRFTVDEYHRMGEAGILDEDARVELVHGQVVQMSPIGARHAACVKRLLALLAPLAGHRATVSIQDPIILGTHEEPQPDVALLRYRTDAYEAALPQAADTLLVIEVADTSLARDRDEKLPLYAGAGIPEAWLVDLPEDLVEIRRTPERGGYIDVRVARRSETIAPLAFPDVALAVAAILG